MTATAPPPLPANWRDLPDWDKARLRWLYRTVWHPINPRPDMVVPNGLDWEVLLWLSGRGFGKTSIGAEDVSDFCRRNENVRYAGVAATIPDGRDVMVEGETGILSCVPPSAIRSWNRSLGELIFANGARFDLYTSEKPGQLRGPQHHRAWVDELGKFNHMRATWDQLMFGLRLGDDPRCIVTTTPVPSTLIEELRAEPTTLTLTGSTYENAANLSPVFLERMRRRYEGTQLGLQELYGVLLSEYLGALWQRVMFNAPGFRAEEPPALDRVAIGVDPSGYSPEGVDDDDEDDRPGFGKETGIVVAGLDFQNPPHVWVLEDLSASVTADEWGHVVVDAWRKYDPTATMAEVVPETNLNGPAVLQVIRGIDQDVRLYYEVRNGKRAARPGVHATGALDGANAKRARAEPVSALYQQGRVHHVGRALDFTELETQMVTWNPRENWSPDRIDALVWAITALDPWYVPAPAGSSADYEQGRVRR